MHHYMVKSVGVKQKGEKKVKIISTMGRISRSSEHHASKYVTKQRIILTDYVLLQNLCRHALGVTLEKRLQSVSILLR